MILRRFTCVFGFCAVIYPAFANNYTAVATPTAATDVVRQLPVSTTIPAIRSANPMQREQILCLALAMYHEARGETEAERLAVAQVIYNRAIQADSTVCSTVWADHGSQFQWVKSTGTIVPRERSVWEAVQTSAVRFVRHRPADSTHGATNFYNPALCSPNWANDGHVTVSLRQVFLRIDGRNARSGGTPSNMDPTSQVDRFGRLRPTRSYDRERS